VIAHVGGLPVEATLLPLVSEVGAARRRWLAVAALLNELAIRK